MSTRRLPLTRLNRYQWRRLFDFASLVALLCFLAYVGAEVYLAYGVDFRGYYAAARVVLAGGDPYDYRLVSQVLLDVTGEMGNNPYYYPPWFCLSIVPLALLPFQVARLIWIVLTLVVYWFAARVSFEVLGWELRGWRRWAAVLSGAYLFVWLSIRSEQLGTWLFFVTVLSLWAYQRDKAWLSGVALAMLLTKPNVTWLTVPLLGLLYWQRQRRAVWWALLVLGSLLLVSTLILPGWYQRLAEPGFGAGLTQELDGPDRVKSGRLNTVLSDWLGQWGIAGPLYWLAWGLLAAGSVLLLFLSWRNESGVVYLAVLGSALGLLLTPYALQYDYPPLLLALFWVYAQWSRLSIRWRWVAGLILAGVFSVPIWEYPVYDGYWMLLGIVVLVVSLRPDLWHFKRDRP